jgi:hypothetical protein
MERIVLRGAPERRVLRIGREHGMHWEARAEGGAARLESLRLVIESAEGRELVVDDTLSSGWEPEDHAVAIAASSSGSFALPADLPLGDATFYLTAGDVRSNRVPVRLTDRDEPCAPLEIFDAGEGSLLVFFVNASAHAVELFPALLASKVLVDGAAHEHRASLGWCGKETLGPGEAWSGFVRLSDYGAWGRRVAFDLAGVRSEPIAIDPDERTSGGWTWTMIAACYGDLAQLAWLLDHGVDLEARNELGQTALVLAARSGRHAVVELLLRRGAAVDSRTDERTTPLMHAAVCGHLAVARALLAAGADPRATDADGDTAAVYADDKGHRELAALLRDAEQR